MALLALAKHDVARDESRQAESIGTTSNIPHWQKMRLLMGLGFEAHRIMS